MRIPSECGQLIQRKADTDSDASRTVIPIDAGQSRGGVQSVIDDPVIGSVALMTSGGRDASREIVDAESSRSFTAEACVRGERAHDRPVGRRRPTRRSASICGGRR